MNAGRKFYSVFSNSLLVTSVNNNPILSHRLCTDVLKGPAGLGLGSTFVVRYNVSSIILVSFHA